MTLTVLQSTAQMQRKTRRPTHPFQVRHLPFQIQPFMIAPVLPGETLEFGNLQSRCVVDPIKSPFVGWWLEHYVFYVPLRREIGWDRRHSAIADCRTQAFRQAVPVPA